MVYVSAVRKGCSVRCRATVAMGSNRSDAQAGRATTDSLRGNAGYTVLTRHSYLFQILAVLSDACAVALSWAACYVLRFALFPYHDPEPPGPWLFIHLLPIVMVCYLVAAAFVRLYEPVRMMSQPREQATVVQAAGLGWLALVAALYFERNSPYSRLMLLMFLVAAPGAMLLARSALRRAMQALRARGWAVQRAAIVGTGRSARRLLRRLRATPTLGFRVDYFITESPALEETIRGVPVVVPEAGLGALLRRRPVDTLFVTGGAPASGDLAALMEGVSDLPIDVSIVPDFSGIPTTNIGAYELEGTLIVQLRGAPLRSWSVIAKRAMDAAGALTLLALLGAPMAAMALLIKLTSPGPVFYRQERMSLGGRTFTMFKFRSMRIDAETGTGPTWATKDDPRCTPLGRLLRRTNLDELPQLFNILRGDMSLVGPRPERPCFVDHFTQTHRRYMLRHSVKAGLTGWAQVNGYRGDTPVERRLRYDLYYINNWSLSFDFLILMLTPFRGFKNAF